MASFAERMKPLRERFEQRARADLEELQGRILAQDHQAAGRILHGLAGNAGMFGYPELGEASRDLEQALGRGVAEPDIRQMLHKLLNACPAPPCQLSEAER